MAPESGTGPDGFALRQAQKVVGLYGDPDVTWGICLDVVFDDVPDLTQAPARLAAMARSFPALGAAPRLERVPAAQWDERREEYGSRPFTEDGQLVRLLVREDGKAFFVVVHHGVGDGLGMLAIAGIATGRPLASNAKGVGDTPARSGFLLSSLLRLGEAVVTPPARFAGTGAVAGAPERLDVRRVVADRVNGAVVAKALLDAHAAWPRGRSSGGRRFLLVMGASRRTPNSASPDRDTAYLRVPLAPGSSLAEVTLAIQQTAPEPDFPETSAGGVGPRVLRRLKGRLGYTANLANLGIVTGQGLRTVAVFPAVNGPQAVGVGLVTAAGGTMLSIRTRRTDFSDAEAEALRQVVLDAVSRIGVR